MTIFRYTILKNHSPPNATNSINELSNNLKYMTMKIVTAIIVIFTFMLFSCTKKIDHCSETAGIESSYMGLSFFSTVNSKYMYAAGVPSIYSMYNKDSLVIKNEFGAIINFISITEQVPNENKLYYKFLIQPIYNYLTDSSVYLEEINRKFYIQYNSFEKDTLLCTFKANKNDCNSYLEYLKIYYRNNLIGSSNDGLGANIIINKP